MQNVLILLFISLNFSWAQKNDSRKETFSPKDDNYFLLFNGRIVDRPDISIKGDPYLQDFPSNGSIKYHGRIINTDLLLFDIEKRKLLTELSGRLIELPEENIDEFYLDDKYFKWLVPKPSILFLDAGYYEIIYDGGITLYARRQKVIKEEINNYQIERSYVRQDRYFLLVDDKFVGIRNRTNVKDALRSKLKMITQYIKVNKLDFSEKFESSLLKLCRAYDSN